MSTSFAEVFRPKSERQLVGESQRAVTHALIEGVENNTFRNEVLFIGPSGVGKTTIARIFASKVLQLNDDENLDDYMLTVNCSADTGIDNIRENVIKRFPYAPWDKPYQVFYLDELHGLSKSAQNSLLAVIEPVPSHVILMASTTEENKIIRTLADRFDKHKLHSPLIQDFQKKAGWVVAALNREGNNYTLPDDIRDMIIAESDGSLRVFDRLLQNYFEGSYKPSIGEAEDKKSLLHQIIYKKPDLPVWFKLANEITDYTGQSNSWCQYAIKVLSGKPSQDQSFKCKLILDKFGDGLSNRMAEKVSFYTQLLRLYNELI